MIMKEFKKVLIAGNGDLSIGMGIESNTDLPFISIRQLLEKVEVGSDTLDKEGIEALTLLFTNLESLEVLEGACVRVREVLEAKPTQQVIDEDFDGGLTMGQIIPKQETLEEFAKQEAIKFYKNGGSFTDLIILGAKWQQEQEKQDFKVWDELFGILAWKFKPTKSGDMFLDAEKVFEELKYKFELKKK